MELLRLVANLLRALQLASAAVVTGITGYFLYHSNASPWDLARYIYVQAAASLSLVASIVFLLPSIDAFIQVPVDILVSLLWWTAFGLLFQYLGFPCEWVFEWLGVSPLDQQCGKLKADIAFSCVSAIIWMVSGLLNCLITCRDGRQEEDDVRNHLCQREMRQTVSAV